MKNLSALLFLVLSYFSTFSQTQLALLKDPEWRIKAGYETHSGQILNLSNQDIAMIVDVPKVDFAVLSLDQKLSQKWLTSLSGFPLGIGKLKSDILVIAASDKSFFKSFSGTYKAYILDEKTGKVLSEKIIYESNKNFIEQPEFFFSKDASYFRMSIRTTAMRRKAMIVDVDSDKDYHITQAYSIVNFDQQMNQKEVVSPKMPKGDNWTTSSSIDGGLFIATVDRDAGVINTASYIPSNVEPLKIISYPINLKKGAEVSLSSTGSSSSLVNYLAAVYINKEKEVTLHTAKLDFAKGIQKESIEVFDSKHAKALEKSFIAVNKKYDDLQFSKLNFLGITAIEEFEDKLMVSVAPAYVERSSNGGMVTFNGSVLINMYDQEMKQSYHQFIPRTYMSVKGEGSRVSYKLINGKLKMIANVKPGPLTSVSSIYAEMDFKTGQMLQINKIPDQGIKGGYYVKTESISWGSDTVTLPYFDKQRILSSTLGAQIQLLKY